MVLMDSSAFYPVCCIGDCMAIALGQNVCIVGYIFGCARENMWIAEILI